MYKMNSTQYPTKSNATAAPISVYLPWKTFLTYLTPFNFPTGHRTCRSSVISRLYHTLLKLSSNSSSSPPFSPSPPPPSYTQHTTHTPLDIQPYSSFSCRLDTPCTVGPVLEGSGRRRELLRGEDSLCGSFGGGAGRADGRLLAGTLFLVLVVLDVVRADPGHCGSGCGRRSRGAGTAVWVWEGTRTLRGRRGRCTFFLLCRVQV